MNINNQDQKPQLPQARISLFWWIVLTALLIWNFISLMESPGTEVEIPYSTFIKQVQAGNVTDQRRV